MSVSYGGDSITFADGSVQSGGWTGFRNRIINGAMVIDQRKAGASTSVTGSDYFSCDRWEQWSSQANKYTVQRSSTAPTGFVNSMLATSSSAYAVLTGDYFAFSQQIEGNNVADLAWGTASAATVTLSFWIRSSLTGTFGGALSNSSVARSYPFTYTINSANTWEQKTVTITGDTSGTWLTDTGIGIRVWFGFGVGATYSGTAGAWAGADYRSATGATSVVGTNGATFYITGVQLERGSTASSFEYRSYGAELQLCQRYFEKTYEQTVAIGTATENGWEWIGTDCANLTTTGTLQSQRPRFSVTKRTQPIMTVWDATGASAKATRYYVGSGPSNGHACTTDLITVNAFRVFVAGTTTTTNGAFHWAANAEF